MKYTTHFGPVYLTKLEAAEYLRLSPRAIDNLRERGALKAYKPGRKLLFRREDLDAFVMSYPDNLNLDQIVDDITTGLGAG